MGLGGGVIVKILGACGLEGSEEAADSDDYSLLSSEELNYSS